VKVEDGDNYIVAIHVDDIILAGRTDEKTAKSKKALQKDFK
jgi:hypothetical protein